MYDTTEKERTFLYKINERMWYAIMHAQKDTKTFDIVYRYCQQPRAVPYKFPQTP